MIQVARGCAWHSARLYLEACFGGVFVDGETHDAIVCRQSQLECGAIRLILDAGRQLAVFHHHRIRAHRIQITLLAAQSFAECRIVAFLRMRTGPEEVQACAHR